MITHITEVIVLMATDSHIVIILYKLSIVAATGLVYITITNGFKHMKHMNIAYCTRPDTYEISCI